MSLSQTHTPKKMTEMLASETQLDVSVTTVLHNTVPVTFTACACHSLSGVGQEVTRNTAAVPAAAAAAAVPPAEV